MPGKTEGAGGEGDDRGQDGWMASTQHQLNGHESEQTPGEGQGCLACCSPWCRRVGTIKWLDNNNNKSYIYTSFYFWASLVVLVVKNLAANEGDARNSGFIPGSGRSPGEVSGNPLQYSCLENPMDRGAWQSTVHGVTESQTWLKGLSTHAGMNIFLFYM